MQPRCIGIFIDPHWRMTLSEKPVSIVRNHALAHNGARALAVEILLQPGVLGCLHVGDRSCGNDLAVP
jgi:hypothetical protein